METSTSVMIAVMLAASMLSMTCLAEAENFTLSENLISPFTCNRIPIKGETNIPVGVNVTVYPMSDLELVFSIVTSAGYVTSEKTSTVEAPPLANLVGQYYDIKVTADYSGNVGVKLTYDDSNMTLQQESNLQMMQYTPIIGDIVPLYGKVDIVDITTVATCFGATTGSSRWNADADIVRNGVINIVDIATCAKNFGKTAEWTSITTNVDTELNIIHGETPHFSFIGIH